MGVYVLVEEVAGLGKFGVNFWNPRSEGSILVYFGVRRCNRRAVSWSTDESSLFE